jgi:membrane associated rhomboid family serine protease
VVAWGLVPVRLVQGFAAGPDAALASLPPLLTSMFLHGGWLHLVGNLWYLWIFGDNVEDRLGHLRFLLFYLAAGLAAAAVHVLSGPAAHVPTIGASGAVAGVLGAYLVLYPRARVLTLLPLFPFFQVVALPAVLLLGLWLLFQFVSGTLSLGSTGGGVAWWAHVGGFVFGMAVARLGRARPG